MIYFRINPIIHIQKNNVMKAKDTTSANFPHMGTYIQNKIKSQNITNAELARRMNIHQSTINGYFTQHTLQTKTIFKLSQALGFNLFTDIIQWLPEQVQLVNKTAYQETITAQQQQIEDLQKQILLYKEILIRKP